MSDGESATPDRDGAPPKRGDARPGRGRQARAPWERVPVPRAGKTANQPSAGSHTEGVAVADLIARVTGATGIKPVTRRRVDVTAPAEDITVPIPLSDEIPDLAALARTRPPVVAPAHPEQSRPEPPRPQPPAPPIGPPGPPPAQPAEPPSLPPTPSRPAPKARQRRRPALIVGRVATALIAVLALAVTGSAWQWQSAKNKLLNTVAALDPNSTDIRDPNGQIGDENFLIIGVDSRIGANSEMGAGDTSVAQGARSDTIMLVNIPASRKRVVAVSFPRDLAIAPINCQAWDPETGKYGPVYDQEFGEWSDNERQTGSKLNSAYALGGPKCLVKVIQKISGLAINRFMAVDFTGFARMVDAMGGVEVCSTTTLEDAELGPVLTAAGRQMVDGHTALNYVRARSIASEGNGDYGRIKRQQMFLSSLLRSMISSATLVDLDRLDEVVNTFIDDSYVDNVQTRDLVRLGQSLQGINAGRITFATLPTTGYADPEGNEVPRTEDVRRLFNAIIDDQSLPGENDLNETISPPTSTPTTSGSATDSASSSTASSSTASSSTASSSAAAGSSSTTSTAGELTATTTTKVKAVAAEPRDVTVEVANGTERKGLATATTKEFELYGFTARKPNTSSEWGVIDTTTVYYSLGNEQAAATVAATLPGAKIERIDGLGELVQVVLGADFTSLKYPQASGTSLNVDVIQAGPSTPTKLPSDLTLINGADVSCE
jgi:LCP family protein required for cell wall assembly